MSRGTRTEGTATPRRGDRQPRPRRTPVSPPISAVSRPAHAAAVLTTVTLAVVVYHGCLHGAFVFDDLNAVAQSELIRSIWPVTRFLASTRPLVDFGFALDYALGGLDTWWFHLTNIALHALSCVVVYFLVLRTLTLPAVVERYGAQRQPIAWAAAALFAVHPLASETVAYISSRSEVQVAFFYLLTLYAYAVANTARGRARRAALVAIPLITAAALGSKEIAVTLPAALLLYDWIFLAGGEWRQTRPRWHVFALALIPLVAGAIVLVALRPGALFSPYSQAAGFNFERYTRLQFLMTQLGVILYYLRLVFVPVGLNFDYDWPLTVAPSAAVALNLIVLATLAGGAIVLRRAQPLLAFALLFTFLVLAPTSSLVPLADLAVERRMYIPLAAFALLAAGTAADAIRWIAARFGETSARLHLSLFAGVVAVPLIVLAALTNARANLWGDDLALHLDAVAKSPNSPRVRLNLGVVYLNTQHVADARRELFEAQRLYDLGESIHAFPRIGAFIYYNLGAVLYVEQEFEKADQELKRALEIGGNYLALRPMAYLIRGHIARNRGDWATTERYLEEAVKYNRDHPDWFLVLAEAQLKQDKPRQAQVTLARLESVHPEASKTDFGKSLYQGIRAALREQAARNAGS